MRLTVLVDNRARPGFEEAWGLSILVETDQAMALFDTGPEPGVLCRNSERLGVSLDSVEAVVISHPHRDHYGGLPCVARHAPGTPVVLPPGPGPLASWIRRLGLAPVVAPGPHPVAPGVVTAEPLRAGIGLWERSLVVSSPRGPVVLLGCSHPGPSSLVEAALRAAGAGRAWLVIGGLHGAPPAEVDKVMELSELLAPIHCSGDAAVYAARRYPGRVVEAPAGTVIEID